MPENYARENSTKNECGRNCRNSSGKMSSGTNGKNSMNEATNRTPLSKQNAAQRKTEDCGR